MNEFDLSVWGCARVIEDTGVDLDRVASESGCTFKDLSVVPVLKINC